MAKKVEIGNINGGENHLKRIDEIADLIANKCEYLFLNFDGNQKDPELALKYKNCFAKFSNIKILKIEVIEDGNLTNILKEMLKDNYFPWF